MGWLVVICYCVLACLRCFVGLLLLATLVFVFCFALLLVRLICNVVCLSVAAGWLVCIAVDLWFCMFDSFGYCLRLSAFLIVLQLVVFIMYVFVILVSLNTLFGWFCFLFDLGFVFWVDCFGLYYWCFVLGLVVWFLCGLGIIVLRCGVLLDCRGVCYF